MHNYFQRSGYQTDDPVQWKCLNPLSPNSDQQQFSPNNIHTLSRDKVMRINKMIIIEKIPWPFIKFSQLILKGDVWRSVWRICMWILGRKGLIQEVKKTKRNRLYKILGFNPASTSTSVSYQDIVICFLI